MVGASGLVGDGLFREFLETGQGLLPDAVEPGSVAATP
jgi:hypothetical protein